MVYNSQFAGCSGVGYGRVGDRSQLTTPSPPAHCQPIRIKPSRGVGSVICTLTQRSLSLSLSLHLSISLSPASSLCSLHITLIFGVPMKIPTAQHGVSLLLQLLTLFLIISIYRQPFGGFSFARQFSYLYQEK